MQVADHIDVHREEEDRDARVEHEGYYYRYNRYPGSARAPAGATAAAAGGGGSSGGGGLPFFLALPFVAAMLDLARRVALDRVATPSEHRSRMPDDPG